MYSTEELQIEYFKYCKGDDCIFIRFHGTSNPDRTIIIYKYIGEESTNDFVIDIFDYMTFLFNKSIELKNQ